MIHILKEKRNSPSTGEGQGGGGLLNFFTASGKEGDFDDHREPGLRKALMKEPVVCRAKANHSD
jgi:hypothetical protein